MKQLRILPYKRGSKSARVLARALNGLRVRFAGKFRPRLRHFVVNWGSTQVPNWWTRGLNNPDVVRRSGNKLSALGIMKAAGVSIPEFTTDQIVASKWAHEGSVVVGRRILNGHGGIGCEVINPERKKGEPIQIPPCPLYTKHLRHKREFRIHVFQTRIIDMVEKRKRAGFENRNSWIRNYNNGYVFCRDNITVPEGVKREALAAVAALGLDFGAVDVAYREKEEKAYVFEVNTAPGIEGTTINSYINAIKAELNK